jgi:hypothetical protein
MIADYLLIAAPLTNLISGNVTSKDIVAANALEKTVPKLIKDMLNGSKPAVKVYKYDLKTIKDAIEGEDDFETSMQKAERLLSKTEIQAAEIIPRISEVKEFLRNALPDVQREDILGVHETEVPFREAAAFSRIYAAIDDPINVVKMIATNSFTMGEVDAIKEVYPEFWNAVIATITDELIKFRADEKELVGYHCGLGIKRVLGVELGKPDVVPKDQQAQAPQAAPQVNMKNINLGKRAFEGNPDQL